MIEYRIIAPPSEDFVRFREESGWGTISLPQAEAALANSLHIVTAFEGTKVMGFGRVVGDGALNFYIQDLIVRPDHRGRKIGSTLLSMLIGEIKAAMGGQACSIGLMSAVDKEAFYERRGFLRRPSNKFGAGMILDIEAGK